MISECALPVVVMTHGSLASSGQVAVATRSRQLWGATTTSSRCPISYSRRLASFVHET
ncbi:Uncharacterised protein [Bordetella pertussis]|nr:Uncharacterised protein [Bordetella pertussis]CFP62869.1 Uncharacterised protein [Bordetella pertussis]CPI23427.1 Uncharacterised protein [Bordetella pertussis]CPL36450.1 Uncharacterised protein [Bordetella pertussis]CPN72677.1 Uncharacterised protein [Bordetella pertussis]